MGSQGDLSWAFSVSLQPGCAGQRIWMRGACQFEQRELSDYKRRIFVETGLVRVWYERVGLQEIEWLRWTRSPVVRRGGRGTRAFRDVFVSAGSRSAAE